MELFNFDDVTKKTKEKKKNIFIPDSPFRMLISGGSGSGKTNVLVNLIVNYLSFDKIYINTKHLHQEKYEFLRNFFNEIEDNEEVKASKMDLPIAYWADKLSEMVPLEQMNEKKKNVIIFDDFIF